MSVNILKKLFYIFGLMIAFSALLSSFFSNIAWGAESENDSCSIFSCGSLASKLQLNTGLSSDLSDVFGTDNPKEAGKDLYKKIYAITNVLPEKNAVKNMAGKYGTTESSTIRLLNNDFSPILERSPHLTQDEAINKMFEIQQRFQEEKDLLELEADVKATVEPNEIFANGNIYDSGFDLVNDLDNIQNILFKKIDPIDIGGTYDASGESTPAGKETKSTSLDTTTSSPAFAGLVSEKSLETGTRTRVLPLEKDTDRFCRGQACLSPTKPVSIASNSNICVVDNNLNKSLQDFAQNKSKDSRLKETPTSKTDTDAAVGTGLKPVPTAAVPTSPPPPEFTYRDPPAPPAKSAPADNWLKKLPCNDIFCLKINFIKKPVTAGYRDHDNCIACHIEKIDAKLKETINHSLVPAKATGNLLEPGLCKSATAEVLAYTGLRFHLIAKPVLTPTNDDLIYGSSIAKEWENFTNTYKPFPFEEKNAAKPKSADTADESDEAPTSEVQKSTAKVYTESSEATKQEDVLKTIQEQSKKTAIEREKAIAVAETAVQSDVSSGFYQAIQRELEQMNSYFDSFRDIFGSLHKREAGSEGACVLLKSKKECK